MEPVLRDAFTTKPSKPGNKKMVESSVNLIYKYVNAQFRNQRSYFIQCLVWITVLHFFRI